jgi:putative membrane protein
MLTALLGTLVLGQMVPGSSMIRPRPVRQVSDAEILGAINARDANLIEVSTLASTKASSGEVKAFAADVLQDHQRSLTRGGELAKELGLSRELPADSAMARMQVEVMDRLSLLSGAAFDQAYVKYVLDAHDAEIIKVTRQHAPAAQDASIKAYVAERLPALRVHQTTATTWLGAHGT